MIRACEQWLADRGIAKLNLMVRDDNATARRFYAAVGYTPDGVIVFSRRLTPGSGDSLAEPGLGRRP